MLAGSRRGQEVSRVGRVGDGAFLKGPGILERSEFLEERGLQGFMNGQGLRGFLKRRELQGYSRRGFTVEGVRVGGT
jgi:hypothetical protein